VPELDDHVQRSSVYKNHVSGAFSLDILYKLNNSSSVFTMFFNTQSLGVVALAGLATAVPSGKHLQTREVGKLPALGWNGWVSSSRVYHSMGSSLTVSSESRTM
jgi:hypothetical protein